MKQYLALTALALTWGSATQAAPLAEWNFATTSREALIKSWTFNQAAQESGAVAIEDGALTLRDVTESGTPQLDAGFKPSASGTLSFAAGTSGVQNQFGAISLLAGDKVVARINITNNTAGEIAGPEGGQSFADASWLNDFRNFELKWQGATAAKPGMASFTFLSKDGSKNVTFNNLVMLDKGIPNGVRLEAGFAKGINRALRFKNLRVSTD